MMSDREGALGDRMLGDRMLGDRMLDRQAPGGHGPHDRAPGVHGESAGWPTYTVGLGLAILATIASFVVSQTNLLWEPGVPVGLIVLAIAQIGVHLVFFLHLGSGPDHTNNILALAFGILIVFLVIAGSVWIITHLHDNMMPTP